MSDVQTLLERNAAYAATHEVQRPVPAMGTLIVSCLDARTDPASFLGVRSGDAVVVRNGGGRVTPDVERDVAFLSVLYKQMSGNLPKVALVHHTGCGMQRLADPHTLTQISRASGLTEASLQHVAIHDPADSLREDLDRLRRSSVVPEGVLVTGLIYDTVTGVAEVQFEELI